MYIGITTILISLVYCLLIVGFYFSKKRLNNIDNKIYRVLLVINIVGLLLELCCCLLVPNKYAYPILNSVVNRLYLVYILSWVFLFTIYSVVTLFGENKKISQQMKTKTKSLIAITILLYIILWLLILFGELKFHYDGVYVYSYGLAAEVIYIPSIIGVIIDILSILINRKYLKVKKVLPIASLIFCLVIVMLIRYLNPGLLLITATFSFVTVLMYHTIENPDLKLINQLELAKDLAEKANHAKTDFLSSMSHEIRTPLNAIVGFSECIENANSLEEAKEDAKDIVTASRHLLELVNGILDISKIEADKMKIVNTEYNLREILDTLTKLIVSRIGEKDIEVKTNFASDIPEVLYGDSGKVKQIITNVLTNAAKYTEKGEINFNVSCVNNDGQCRLVITIKDTGRGIKTEQIEKLFTKFQRLDEDKNTTVEGTGLGLAITKRLVEMMGGKIVVQSEYGEGSIFTIYLTQEIRNTLHKKEENDVEKVLKFDNKKVLLVDDNKLNLKVGTKILKEYNVNITCVESGFECIEKVKKNKYDIILMDIMMPKMSGLETLKSLKEFNWFKTPVIALTADAIQGRSKKYLEVGFSAYLSKPIEKNELGKVLSEFLSYREEKVEIVESDLNKMDINYLKENDIDVDSSIELLGDIEMYNETLKDFLNESEERLPKMDKFLKEKDSGNYAILAHAMKSDSKYLGFKKLAELSLNHELEGKNNNIEYLESNYGELMNEANKIIDIVKKYLGGK